MKSSTGMGLVSVLIAASVLAYSPMLPAPVSTCVAGDVRARMEARVPDSMQEVYLDAKKMRFGIGYGAVGGWESLGEAAVIGDRLWLRTTHKASPRYYHLVSNRYFQTSAFVYVPKDVSPVGELRLTKGGTLKSVWEQLAADYPKGVMVSGHVKLQKLNLIAIAEPPIASLAIEKNVPYYYTRPMESFRDTWAYVVGISINKFPRFDGTQRRLYKRVAPLVNDGVHPEWRGYAHALRLKASPEETGLALITNEPVSIGQLIDTSLIEEGVLQLFPIRRIEACTEAYYSNTSDTPVTGMARDAATLHTTFPAVSFFR